MTAPHENSHPDVDSGDGAPRLQRFEDDERRAHHDPRDAADIDPDVVNSRNHYALFAVFRLAAPLPALGSTRERIIEDTVDFVEGSGVTTRGWYDIAGLRSDADLLVWWLDESPDTLQDAYHRMRASSLGYQLGPVWSCLGLHAPAEHDRKYVPACLGGVAPRDWCLVRPFVRSHTWYRLPAEERARITAAHGGGGGSSHPDVKDSMLAAYGMSDYEWILAFETDTLERLESVVHHQRHTDAHLHASVSTPFYTGRRVGPREWGERQPRA